MNTFLDQIIAINNWLRFAYNQTLDYFELNIKIFSGFTFASNLYRELKEKMFLMMNESNVRKICCFYQILYNQMTSEFKASI